MRRFRSAFVAVLVFTGVGGMATAHAATSARTGTARPIPYSVYWDQNEQQDLLSMPSGKLGQLIPPWDPNGQMCILPDGSGRFVTGYNPTTDPTNPGFNKPAMQPPVGEVLWNRDGTFSGQTIYIPGPYMLTGQTVGGDIPPDSGGTYNNNGTFVGCAFDHNGNLFATDLGTAQGQFPSPDDGRLIEWFGPSYTDSCIVDGPTAGGVGPHHVDGTGGLAQPGDLAVTPQGDILVPEAGPASAPFSGRVLRYFHKSLPTSAAQCGPNGIYPRSKLHRWAFIQGSLSLLPFPQSVAFDVDCWCYGVASTIGNPAIAWFDQHGHQITSMGVVPGETITQVGQPNGYNPYGLAFAPGGVAYFADIHIVCSAPLTNCGPATNGGRIMRVTFTNGKPDKPVPIASGYNFPTSVTVCIPSRMVCPQPVATAQP